MRFVCATIWVLVAFVSPVVVASAAAQSTASGAPTLIPISGVLQTPTGEPRTGSVLLVLSLYDRRDDPAPRWIEHQVVTLDAAGTYDVRFGSTLAEGLPADLFSGTTAVRWAGVAVENEPEQPPIMLVGVPYAAKATTADTLAGRTATDFVLTADLTDQVKAVLQEEERSGGYGPVTNAASLNLFQKGDGAGGFSDSGVVEVGGYVGIGHPSPLVKLDVRGAAANDGGKMAIGNSDGSDFISFYGGQNNDARSILFWADGNDFVYGTASAPSGVGFSEKMRVSASGNVGIGTASPTAKLHVAGNVTVDGNSGAKYQDVAEWVDSVEPLEPGTVVVIDVSATNRVVAAPRSYDSRVAGAVSAQPGVVLGEPGPGRLLVAQSGRVRIKADARNGAIRPGDLLVTSSTKGYAMRSQPVNIGGTQVHRPGTVIGKALEALPKGRGEILVLLTLQWLSGASMNSANVPPWGAVLGDRVVARTSERMDPPPADGFSPLN